MGDRTPIEELSVEELQQLLYRKKRAHRRRRLQRLKAQGRVVEVDGLTPPDPERPAVKPAVSASPAISPDGTAENGDELPETEQNTGIRWRWVANKLLLLVEVAAVVGLAAILLNLWSTGRELNQELAQVQQQEAQSLALPTPTATPVIDVVILPTGHRYVEGRPAVQEEAGEIPAHLLPYISNYEPPPIPTPGPEQARRIQIPAIEVDSPIVQGLYDWEQLKKGVAQHIGSAQPGQNGNMILGAHNDIFGEIFRELDKLTPGDEIIVSTERQSYTYVVRDIDIVEPTNVESMKPTEHASATLISCYPYRKNTQRIIVYADLASSGT